MATTYTPQQVLAAIMRIESGGNYTAHSKTSSASGAYQYIDKTWANFGGYAHAYQAPQSVQDAKAVADITNKIHHYGGNIADAIMSWFLPAAVGNPALAGKVPKGNGISPNQYVAKVMKALGAPVPAHLTTPGAPVPPADGSVPPVTAAPEQPNLHDEKTQLANFLTVLATGPQQQTAAYQ